MLDQLEVENVESMLKYFTKDLESTGSEMDKIEDKSIVD